MFIEHILCTNPVIVVGTRTLIHRDNPLAWGRLVRKAGYENKHTNV
jgi:hypothetical protein